MSKCVPIPLPLPPIRDLIASKGVVFNDIVEKSAYDGKIQRSIIIKIPYEAIINEPEVQRVFQDIIRIVSDEEAQSYWKQTSKREE